MITFANKLRHPAYGHLLPLEEREKAKVTLAFSRFFQREKVAVDRMRGW